MDRSGNLIGAGGLVMMSAGSADNCKSLAAFGPCLNARASIVSKQVGADPHLPGPGQYINPLTEGLSKLLSPSVPHISLDLPQPLFLVFVQAEMITGSTKLSYRIKCRRTQLVLALHQRGPPEV